MIQNKGYAIISLNWGVNQSVSIDEEIAAALASVSGITPNKLIMETLEVGTIHSREDYMIDQNMIIIASTQELLNELKAIVEEHGKDADVDGVLTAILETDDVDGVYMNFLLITPDKELQTFEELHVLRATSEDPKAYEAIYLPMGFSHLDERKEILQKELRSITIAELHLAVYEYLEDKGLLNTISLPVSAYLEYQEDDTAYTSLTQLRSVDLMDSTDAMFDHEKTNYESGFDGYEEVDEDDAPASYLGFRTYIRQAIDSMDLRSHIGTNVEFDTDLFDKIAQHRSV